MFFIPVYTSKKNHLQDFIVKTQTQLQTFFKFLTRNHPLKIQFNFHQPVRLTQIFLGRELTGKQGRGMLLPCFQFHEEPKILKKIKKIP